MRIVITRFPLQSQLGGLETIVLNLAQKLREQKHEVSFAGSCPVLLDLFAKNNFPTEKISPVPSPVSKSGLLAFTLLYPWLVWRFWHFVRQLQSGDAIYMLSLAEKLALTKIAHRKGVKVIWGEHEALMDEHGKFRNWLARNPFVNWYRKNSRLARVVPVSESLRRQFQELGGVSNLTVIANGIDTSFFTPSYQPSYQAWPGKFVIGTSARLKPEKGIREFLEIALKVSAKIPSSHFVIAGDGSARKDLEQFVTEHRLESFVTFLGEIPYERMRDIYNMFDVSLFLSQRWETFGLAALESMAMKKTTILTSAFGFLSDEMKKNLLVIDPQGIDQAVALIERLYADELFRKETAEKGYQLVQEKFSLEVMATAYEQLFQRDFF